MELHELGFIGLKLRVILYACCKLCSILVTLSAMNFWYTVGMIMDVWGLIGKGLEH